VKKRKKKTLFAGVKTYAKNVAIHLRRVITRRERIEAAVTGIRRDARKLSHEAKHARQSEDRRQAVKLLERGRQAYNAHNYEAARNYLREAILSDPKYALAYTYMGNTVYKLGLSREAIGYWRQAVTAEPDSKAAAMAMRKMQRVDQTKKDIEDWIKKRTGEED
jgi:tetratricopeptide (TPR) repeat protein